MRYWSLLLLLYCCHFLPLELSVFFPPLLMYDWQIKNFYIFTWPHRHVESWFPDQESNLCPLHWKCRVLTTGSPEKSCIIHSWKTPLPSVTWYCQEILTLNCQGVGIWDRCSNRSSKPESILWKMETQRTQKNLSLVRGCEHLVGRRKGTSKRD